MQKCLLQKYDEDLYDTPKSFCWVYGLFIYKCEVIKEKLEIVC
jgi:hypothetical protein